MSTPDPDSETAVTPPPAQQTPTEPSDSPDAATEAPTEQVEADEAEAKTVEVTGEPVEPVEAVTEAEKPADDVTEAVEPADESAQPAGRSAESEDEPAEPADDGATEPVKAVEQPAEEPADDVAEPVEALEQPADDVADEVTEPVVALDRSNEPATDSEAAGGLRSRRMLVPIVLAVLALGSAVAVAVLGWQAFSDARAQRARDAALDAARTSTVQVLSYDSKTLDADLARSRSLISGAFAAKFEELASSVIEPAVKQQSLGTKATVARSAVIDAQPDQVRALLFVNQSTTVGSDPTAHTASNQVRVTMTWTDGRWLISDLQPL